MGNALSNVSKMHRRRPLLTSLFVQTQAVFISLFRTPLPMMLQVLLMPDPPSAYGRRSIQPFATFTATVWAAVMVSYVVRGLLMQKILDGE